MQQVHCQHLQQEQVRKLLPRPRAALERGPRGEQGDEDREQVRILVRSTKLGCRRRRWNGEKLFLEFVLIIIIIKLY